MIVKKILKRFIELKTVDIIKNIKIKSTMFLSEEITHDNKKVLALFGKFFSSVYKESDKLDVYRIISLNEH